jgi:hypothetical protein
MKINLPKKNDKYQWTAHALFKMQFYGLSPQRITRVIKSPQRTEEGIVEKTIAVMQKASQNKKSGEIWVMYQLKTPNPKSKGEEQSLRDKLLNKKHKLRIISAWRYPGISPKRDPIPEEILDEIKNLI